MGDGATMTCTIGLAQCAHPADGDAVRLVEDYAQRAAEAGVDLLVFPECLMTPFESTPEEFRATAETQDGPFAHAMEDIARKHGLWIVHTMNERHEGAPSCEDAGDTAARHASPQPYNTVRIVDAAGACRGFYRKTHLFDTPKLRESERVSAGDQLFSPIETPFGRIGLSICYDLRFPEIARAAALAGCDILINPAAWVAGPRKAEQWRTLLAARAIENELFAVGVSRADPKYSGFSCIVSPTGELIAEGGANEKLIVGTIDLADAQAMRKAIPVFAHRRPKLYPTD